MSNCKIDSDGSQRIAEALKKSKLKLQNLNLGNNQLELEGAVAFAEYFSSLDTLCSITLNQASLNGEGVKVIVESVVRSAVSGSLWHFDIGGNMVMDKETVLSLCELLR